MSIVWSEIQTLKLVILYSRHECLWNPFHPDFKNKLCRYKAYKDIVDCMNTCDLTVCDCIKKITQIRVQYCYDLSKITAAISCEKIYKPKANWFPIMHEILFPFIKTYGYRNDSWKVCNNERDPFKNYRNNEINDQLYLKKMPGSCNCTRTNCDYSEFDKMKPPISSKKCWTAVENNKGTSYLHSQVTRINTGCNPKDNTTTENEMQTDLSSFKTKCRACQTCTTDNTIVMSNSKDFVYENNTTIDEQYKTKRKVYDEFEMFGKSIACQLRNINFEVAIKLEERIQNLIAQERLNKINLKSISHSFNAACCSSNCSECKVVRNETVCKCGLPVIKIQTDASCEFYKQQI
nr:uncharacterized protein LOC116434606 [Nomia melanderi]